MDISTICVHGCEKKYDTTGAVSVPIFSSSTFAHPGVGQSTGFDYSRTQNPTKEHLEHTLTALEGGAETIAFSSGMAAVSALMELFSPGDHIVASYDLYGGTFRLFSHISEKNGIKISYAVTEKEIAEKITQATKAIFIETPTNPMMNVVDIAAVAQIKKNAQNSVNKILLIVDNTFLTPIFQKPLSLGADIVLHSATKYLGGHNDALAGMLTVKENDLAERLRYIAKTTGACLSPFDSFLIIRGIKTLAIRMERHNKTALAVAKWLSQGTETIQRKVKKVYYTGLQDHPNYAVSCRQASGFGGMISFTVDSEQTAKSILENVKIIKYAESLGGTESLITYPLMQTHSDLPEDERKRRGINACLLRLSVGLESENDIIEDLKQALGDI
jgi:cystathionine gamma-synthase